MPVKRFWFYNKQVDRLAAEDDLRTLHLLGSATSNDAYKKAHEGLRKQMGEIFVIAPEASTLVINTETTNEPDPAFNRAGLHALRSMGSIR